MHSNAYLIGASAAFVGSLLLQLKCCALCSSALQPGILPTSPVCSVNNLMHPHGGPQDCKTYYCQVFTTRRRGEPGSTPMGQTFGTVQQLLTLKDARMTCMLEPMATPFPAQPCVSNLLQKRGRTLTRVLLKHPQKQP